MKNTKTPRKHFKHSKILVLTLSLLLLTGIGYSQDTGLDSTTQEEQKAKQMLEKRADKALQIIQFLGFLIAAPFGSYQGYKYITSEHDPARRKEAKIRLGQIVVGLVIIEVFPLIIQWLF